MNQDTAINEANAIIDKFLPRIANLARKNGLNVFFGGPVDNQHDKHKRLLEVRLCEHEYRRELQVTIKNGALRFWSLVTDLKDGTWQQHIVENITVSKFEANFDEGLTKVEAWIKENAQYNPKEQARIKAGTQYYWEYSNNDDIATYNTEFENGWTGAVYDCRDAHITDENGHEKYCVIDHPADSAKELMLMVEAKYAELSSVPKP